MLDEVCLEWVCLSGFFRLLLRFLAVSPYLADSSGRYDPVIFVHRTMERSDSE